jgi:hypothetical protein
VCFCGGVALSGGDGADPHTQVPVVRCVWVPVTMSYRAWHLMLLLPEDLPESGHTENLQLTDR